MHTIIIVNAVISWIFLINDGNAEVVDIIANTGDTVHLPCTSRIRASSWQHQTGPSTTLYYVWVEGTIGPKYVERFTVPLASLGNYTLVISNVSNTDYGLYHCVEVGGSDGAEEHSILLSVVDVTSTSSYISTQPAVVNVSGVSRWSVAVFVCSVLATAFLSVVITWRVFTYRRRNASAKAAPLEETKSLTVQEENTAVQTLVSAVTDDVTVEKMDIVMDDSTSIIYRLSLRGQVFGTASIGNVLYVLHQAEQNQITAFDKLQYTVRWKLTIPGLQFYCNSMASCKINTCLYVSDCNNQCIRKVDLQPLSSTETSSWSVNFRPRGISVTASGSVLVACQNSLTLKRFASDGNSLGDIEMKGCNLHPFHAVELCNGDLVVSLGYWIHAGENNVDDDSYNVVIIDTNGNTVKSFDKANKLAKLKAPRHLSVGENDSVFVADCFNNRILLLNSNLEIKRQVISPEDMLPNPYRLFYDQGDKRLYVSSLNTFQVTVIQL